MANDAQRISNFDAGFPSHAENVSAKGDQPTLLAARRSAGVALRGE